MNIRNNRIPLRKDFSLLLNLMIIHLRRIKVMKIFPEKTKLIFKQYPELYQSIKAGLFMVNPVVVKL